MIQSFRVEAVQASKANAIKEASEFGARVISLLKTDEHQTGEWECTDDVTSMLTELPKIPKAYITRMKFVYRGHQ